MADDALDSVTRKLKDTLSSTGSAIYESGKKIADQNFNVANAGEAVSKVFGNLGPAGDAAGTVLRDVAKYGQDSVTAWQSVSKFGLSFGNDAIGLRTASAATRMSFEEYNATINKNKDLLVGMGGSINQGAKAFNDMSNELFKTTAADDLRKMGYTTQELNDVLMVSVSNNRMVNMNDQAAKKAAIQSATELAVEMDAMAKMTGKSREEQLKELKEKQKDVQYQAQERLMMQGLTNEEKKERAAAMESLKTSAGNMGPAVASVVKEMVTGGVRSKEAAATMSLLGPAGRELQAAVNAAKSAKTDTEREAAQERIKRAEDAVLRVQESKAFNEQVAIGNEAAMGLAKGSQAQMEGLDAIAAANNLNLKDTEQYNQARKIQREEALKQQKEKPAGAGTTEAIVQFNNRAKDAGAAINEHLIKPLNNLAGKRAQAPGGLNEKLRNVQGGQDYKSNIGEKIDKGKTSIKELFGVDTGQAPQKPRTKETSIHAEQNAPGMLSGVGEMVTKMFRADVLSVGELVMNQNRDSGTLGMTGKMFEPADFIGKVQAGETVMTQAQLQNLVTGVQRTNLADVTKNLSSSFRSMSKDVKKEPSIAELQQQAMGMANAVKAPTSAASDLPAGSKGASLSDVVLKLDQLNSNVTKLIAISHTTAENSSKQIKVTKGLGGDLFA